MPSQYWTALANSATPSQSTTGTALANSTALTDISPGGNAAGQAFTVPAGFAYPGQQWRFRANGIFSTTGTPTLLLGLYWGGVGGVALAATAATTTATGVANGAWLLEATARVATVGATGTILTLGAVTGIASTTAPVLMPATSATGGSATVSTSTAQIITVGAQWGTASASNTITCYQWLVELLN